MDGVVWLSRREDEREREEEKWQRATKIKDKNHTTTDVGKKKKKGFGAEIAYVGELVYGYRKFISSIVRRCT